MANLIRVCGKITSKGLFANILPYFFLDKRRIYRMVGQEQARFHLQVDGRSHHEVRLVALSFGIENMERISLARRKSKFIQIYRFLDFSVLSANINDKLVFAIRHVGIVKYDAFNHMGGNLSYAVALLDDHHDGMVMNTVQSVDGCYTYCKIITAGKPDVELGKEEKEALEKALEIN